MNRINKYIPKNINDFIIDDKIKTLLNTFIKIEQINLLFVGDNGTGKTTIINCLLNEYYSVSERKNNILYIDNLKEQGINTLRQSIKNFCLTTNKFMKKKTIVLDDIDLLNNQTQQIIRHCINQYKHINFLLSCNNLQKVLDNIQSRTNIIKLKYLQNDKLEQFLSTICKKEKISISHDAEKYLVSICNNSIHLLINYIEKLLIYQNKIDKHIIKHLCTNVNYTIYEKYTYEWYENRNIKVSTKIIYSFIEQGYSVIDILENYYYYIKNINKLLDNIKLQILPYIIKYMNIFYNNNEDDFELILFTNDLIKNIN